MYEGHIVEDTRLNQFPGVFWNKGVWVEIINVRLENIGIELKFRKKNCVLLDYAGIDLFKKLQSFYMAVVLKYTLGCALWLQTVGMLFMK